MRQKKKHAISRLKHLRDFLTRRNDEDPCVAAVYRWMLLFIGFSRFLLWTVGVVAGAIGKSHTVTWIAVLTTDLFEISGYCSIAYLYCDLREGSKKKQVRVCEEQSNDTSIRRCRCHHLPPLFLMPSIQLPLRLASLVPRCSSRRASPSATYARSFTTPATTPRGSKKASSPYRLLGCSPMPV